MEHNYANIFKALSDENRLKILELLIQGETCGCTLIDKLPISQPTLSYHLKILTQSGIITAKREGNWIKHYVDYEKLDQLTHFILQLKVSKTTCDM